MCLVPINAEIKTKQDVYFLVSCIIDRQMDGFLKVNIFDIAKKSLKGSSFKITDDALNSIINQQVDILYRNGFISVCKNHFNYINNYQFP